MEEAPEVSLTEIHSSLVHRELQFHHAVAEHCENDLLGWVVQAAVLDASAASEKHSLAVPQRKVSEVVLVLAASSQDAEVWYAVVVYYFEETGIDFAGMEEENRRTVRSGNLEAHSGIEAEARSETAQDHFGIDLVHRFGKEAAHFEIAEGHCGMKRGHSETEEVVHSGIEVENRDRLAG